MSGVTPTNLAAAAGQYDWWFEAYTQRAATIASPGGLALYNWLKGGELQTLAGGRQLEPGWRPGEWLAIGGTGWRGRVGTVDGG